MACEATWQALNKVNDPKLGTVRRFTKATGVDVKELL